MIHHDPLREVLRGVLVAAVEPGPGIAGGIDSIQSRACAALYALLTAHPVDRQGRCRACRRPGVVLGLGHRRCRVHSQVRFWLLQQPAEFLTSQLISELELTRQPLAQHGATRARTQDLVPR